jgi:hypothetical protein
MHSLYCLTPSFRNDIDQATRRVTRVSIPGRPLTCDRSRKLSLGLRARVDLREFEIEIEFEVQVKGSDLLLRLDIWSYIA